MRKGILHGDQIKYTHGIKVEKSAYKRGKLEGNRIIYYTK